MYELAVLGFVIISYIGVQICISCQLCSCCGGTLGSARRDDDDVELPVTAPPPPPQAAAAAAPVGRQHAGGRSDEIVLDTFIQEKAKEDRQVGCAICLMEYEDGETLAAVTVCHHIYHDACIKAWLKEHDTCPLCRTQV